MTEKIVTIAHVPSELQQAWLQHLRDFHVSHPGCHFEVGLDTPDIPLRKIIEMLRLDPGLDLHMIFQRKQP